MMLRRILQEINRTILLTSSFDKGIESLIRQKEELHKKIAEYEEAIDLLNSKKSVRKTANRESKDPEAKVVVNEPISVLKEFYDGNEENDGSETCCPRGKA
jgi:uncharacterized protein Yka (UPF0111/DUF47 family)